MKHNNHLWEFFASVKLAIFTLCSLAVTSVIGTVIPQHKPESWYVENYGSTLAVFFQVLDIPTMYGSWWFLILLGLLCTNLIICSIDRFPTAWRLITADQLAIPVERLQSMRFREEWRLPGPVQETAARLESALNASGWKTSSRTLDSDLLVFAGKYAWSRLGVYLVHLSILIIFAGAVIGNFLGYKGTVMIPEGKSTETIFASANSEPIDLGFEIFCDSFTVDYYPNGMPKEYKSELIIRENGKDVLQEAIEVNKPLTYKGITFYQSSFQAYQDFIIKLAIQPDRKGKVFTIPYQRETEWAEENLRFGVINAEGVGERVTRLKVWFKDGDQPASTFWVEPGKETTLPGSGRTIILSAKQMYATGLQVAKDPGVWLVYFGCGLMLAGLYIAFFLSHQRIWLLIAADTQEAESRILLAGASHKNATGFAGTFRKLADNLRRKEA